MRDAVMQPTGIERCPTDLTDPAAPCPRGTDCGTVAQRIEAEYGVTIDVDHNPFKSCTGTVEGAYQPLVIFGRDAACEANLWTPWELAALYETLGLLKTFLGENDVHIRGHTAIRRVHVTIQNPRDASNPKASMTDPYDPGGKYRGMSVIRLTTDMFYPGNARKQGLTELHYWVMHELFHAYSFNHGAMVYGDPYATIVDFAAAAGWRFGFTRILGFHNSSIESVSRRKLFGVRAPGNAPTHYARASMGEDLAETARDFALLWLAQAGHTGDWVYTHLASHTSLEQLPGRLSWMESHFGQRVTSFARPPQASG
jgi:hypothetical protein